MTPGTTLRLASGDDVHAIAVLGDWLIKPALAAGPGRLTVERRASNFAARRFCQVPGCSPAGEIRSRYRRVTTAIGME